MSAFGPKRTSLVAPHMSAFGGKADMAFCGMSLSRSLLGVKRTLLVAPHMSAFDPKRTIAHIDLDENVVNLALLTDGLTAVLLPSTHPVCYPFIEVGRAHSSLYSRKPHIVSDDVAHPCERDRDALVF